MSYEFELLAQGRKNLLGILKPFSTEQLNQIPPGFNNNLVWNLGHVIVSHQILCYKYSGLTPVIPAHHMELYKRGTVPDQMVNTGAIEELKSLAIATISRFKNDYQEGIFKEYNSYQSLYGVKINNIDDAIRFNITHEGLHLGYVMAMRKLFTG